MYWLVVFCISVLLWTGLNEFIFKKDSIPGWIILGNIAGLMAEAFFFAVGCDLPQIYEVKAGTETKYRKRFAAIPWVKYTIDGVEFRAEPGRTYIINSGMEPLMTAEISYTDYEELIGMPQPVARETYRDKLLEFPSARVVVFKEAPNEMETLSDFHLGVRSVLVIALPWQDLRALQETCYRPIRKSSLQLVDSC